MCVIRVWNPFRYFGWVTLMTTSSLAPFSNLICPIPQTLYTGFFIAFSGLFVSSLVHCANRHTYTTTWHSLTHTWANKSNGNWLIQRVKWMNSNKEVTVKRCALWPNKPKPFSFGIFFFLSFYFVFILLFSRNVWVMFFFLIRFLLNR